MLLRRLPLELLLLELSLLELLLLKLLLLELLLDLLLLLLLILLLLILRRLALLLLLCRLLRRWLRGLELPCRRRCRWRLSRRKGSRQGCRRHRARRHGRNAAALAGRGRLSDSAGQDAHGGALRGLELDEAAALVEHDLAKRDRCHGGAVADRGADPVRHARLAVHRQDHNAFGSGLNDAAHLDVARRGGCAGGHCVG